MVSEAKQKGFLYSNSALKCSRCKVIFPIEYNMCPQCEVDELWQKMEIQIVNSLGGIQN